MADTRVIYGAGIAMTGILGAYYGITKVDTSKQAYAAFLISSIVVISIGINVSFDGLSKSKEGDFKVTQTPL